MKLKICLISTKTSLSQFFKAVEEVKREAGVDLELYVFYTHELDEAGVGEEFREAVRGADVVLIDVRSPTSRFMKELPQLLRESRARVIVPLVGGSPAVMGLLKLGGASGDRFRGVEYDFDTQYLDMSKVWKITDAIEAAGRVLPMGPLRDWKNYVFLTKYWVYHGVENLKNMLRLILKEYFSVRHLKYDEPREEVKELSIYDPVLGFFDSLDSYIAASHLDLSKPTIALFIYSGMHFEQSRVVAEAFYKRLRERGVNALIITGGSARSLQGNLDALRKFCLMRGRPVVDAVVNFQWFQLNGGPYGGPSEPTWSLLSAIDAPLFNGLIMYMREVKKWEEDPRGVSPIEVLTAVALPETDGAIEPIPTGGLDESRAKEVVVLEERVAKRVARILNYVKLRRAENSKKRIAVVIYNYPPGEHNVGSAAYLDVFSSLEALLRRLKEEGYAVEPLSKEKLKKLVERFLVNSPRFEYPSDAISLSVEEYLQYFNSLPSELREAVVKTWGQPPGSINVSKGRIIIPGIVLGDVFVGVQPSRGVHEEQDKLYHSKDLPPHHQYLAFYYWVREVFKADAVIHMGTHGTLEFTPGKEVGLSSRCWPDALIGEVPHIYIYHVTNPSEMTIAKRRSYAYVITHGTPPFTKADLYEDYVELEELVREYMETDDAERRAIVESMIKEKCEKLHLPTSIEELHDKLFELKRSIIPKGLHVLGSKWSAEEAVEYLTFVLRYDRDVKSLHRILAEARGLNYDDLLEKPRLDVGGKTAAQVLEEIEREAKSLVERVVRGEDVEKVVEGYPKRVRKDLVEALSYARELYNRVYSSDELGAVVKALRGGYIQPRVAGDPIRTPEVFPTGVHGYAFDPRLIPSKAAYLKGSKIAEHVLRAYRERHGKWPETVGIVLWGFETAGTRGETIGQILQLLGVRLVRKHGPWSWDLEPIPLEELGRPRIDVVVTICGIFRDMFPHLITMIDRAVKLAASLDEPPEMNYVKKRLLELGGESLVRIFGPKDGAYATRLTDLVETAAWKTEEELAEVYIEDMGYGYGEGLHAAPAKELFKRLVAKVDMVTQIRYAHEYEITDLDHYYEFFGGLLNAVKRVGGKSVEGVWVDTTMERVKYRSAAEAIDHAVRTRLLNPKWIDAMLAHGYDGAREIAKRVEYVVGLAATTGEVPSWVFDEIAKRYVFDERIKEGIVRENRWAYYEILKRLYEAYVRGYWKAEESTIRKIREEAAIYEE